MWLLSEPSDSLMMSRLTLQLISLPEMGLKKGRINPKTAGANVGFLSVCQKFLQDRRWRVCGPNLHAGTRVRTYCGNGYRQLLFKYVEL
jgi:hypothetical protein